MRRMGSKISKILWKTPKQFLNQKCFEKYTINTAIYYFSLSITSLEPHYPVKRSKIGRAPLPQSVDGVDASVGGVVDARVVVLNESQVGRDAVSRERREASVNL